MSEKRAFSERGALKIAYPAGISSGRSRRYFIRIDARPQTMWLLVLGFLVAIAGFPLISSFPALFHLTESRIITIPFRAFSIAVSLIVLAVYGVRRRRMVRGPYWFGITALWSLLLLRMVFDLIVHPIQTSILSEDYWPKVLGISLLAPLSLAVVATEDTYATTRKLCLPVLTIAGILIALQGLLSDRGSDYLRSRIETDVLNPISAGHIGAALVILSLSGRFLSSAWRDLALRATAAAAGTFLAIFTDARGPQVALLVCVFLRAATGGKKALITVVLLSVCLAYPYLKTVDYVERSTQIRAFSRWSELADARQSASSGLRISLAVRAFQQFFDHPLTGGALVDPETGLYPHNIVAEAFMATGAVGGIALLALIVFGCKRAVRLLGRGPAYSWLGLLYFEALVGCMFSGSLLTDNSFWTWSHIAAAAGTAAMGRRAVLARQRPNPVMFRECDARC